MKSFRSVLPVILLVLCIVGFSMLQSNRITKLELGPASITLQPGETLQLEVTAYTRDGNPVAKEDLNSSAIGWRVTSLDKSFSVDENGLLTAICEGQQGNVQIFMKRGNLYSKLITVQVTAPP